MMSLIGLDFTMRKVPKSHFSYDDFLHFNVSLPWKPRNSYWDISFFWPGGFDFWPMTFIYKLDLEILPLGLHVKIQVRMLVHLSERVRRKSEKDRHTDRRLHCPLMRHVMTRILYSLGFYHVWLSPMMNSIWTILCMLQGKFWKFITRQTRRYLAQFIISISTSDVTSSGPVSCIQCRKHSMCEVLWKIIHFLHLV